MGGGMPYSYLENLPLTELINKCSSVKKIADKENK